MRWGKMALAAAAIGCGVWAGSMLPTIASSLPATGQPGSADDPLVTKSYVDEQIRNALSGKPVGESSGQAPASSAEIEALKQRIAQLEAEAGKASVPYTVVKLKAGHTLIGEEGTEFIVRTGEAYIHSSPENGIADVTEGIDLANGTLIPKNHLLLVPRSGRGVTVKPDYPNSVYVTVKGEFVELDAEGNPVASAQE